MLVIEDDRVIIIIEAECSSVPNVTRPKPALMLMLKLKVLLLCKYSSGQRQNVSEDFLVMILGSLSHYPGPGGVIFAPVFQLHLPITCRCVCL